MQTEIYELRTDLVKARNPIDMVLTFWKGSTQNTYAVMVAQGMADAFMYAKLITPEQFTAIYKMIGL